MNTSSSDGAVAGVEVVLERDGDLPVCWFVEVAPAVGGVVWPPTSWL